MQYEQGLTSKLVLSTSVPGRRPVHELTSGDQKRIVDCARPGVENILREAAKIDPKLHMVAGGFHLVLTTREEVERVAQVLDDELHVERVAPGHGTSELGFQSFWIASRTGPSMPRLVR